MPAFQRFVRNMTGLEPRGFTIDPDEVRMHARMHATDLVQARLRCCQSLKDPADWLQARVKQSWKHGLYVHAMRGCGS